MIVLQHLTKVFPGSHAAAVDDLCLEVGEGETVALCGTSGCGKTTTLKMINRLIEPTSGRVVIDGADASQRKPEELRRALGYVLQNIGLFPHWTVARNVETVPRLLQWPEARCRERTHELLDLVGLPYDEYAERFPAGLSGGQQQRVGVARALAADPRVILMDEPFGALDPITRESLQDEFVRLKARLRKTIVFVTHDILEAVLVADRIAIMDAGRLVQLATPAELVHRPANEFVSRFLGRHRFLLELMVLPVRRLMEKAESQGVSPGPKLESERSLLDALDRFKESGAAVLGVTDEGGRVIGRIGRTEVLAALQQAATGNGETVI